MSDNSDSDDKKSDSENDKASLVTVYPPTEEEKDYFFKSFKIK